MSYVVEAKHTGGREPIETIVDRYQPQCQWIMWVTNTSRIALSVILGANEPVVQFIERDDDYIAELKRRAEAFMECVWNMTPPVAMAPVAAPVIPTIVYDMTTSNAWASHAADWLANCAGKKIAERCEKELKALVPPDAVACHGHGVIIRRARNGNLSLRESKQ